jgi:hypothetical protein
MSAEAVSSAEGNSSLTCRPRERSGQVESGGGTARVTSCRQAEPAGGGGQPRPETVKNGAGVACKPKSRAALRLKAYEARPDAFTGPSNGSEAPRGRRLGRTTGAWCRRGWRPGNRRTQSCCDLREVERECHPLLRMPAPSGAECRRRVVALRWDASPPQGCSEP